MDSVQSKVMQHETRIKSVEHRVKELEGEMHDLRTLTEAVAVTGAKVDTLHEQFAELHQDVRELKELPAARWEQVVAAVVTGVAGALIGGVIGLVL